MGRVATSFESANLIHELCPVYDDIAKLDAILMASTVWQIVCNVLILHQFYFAIQRPWAAGRLVQNVTCFTALFFLEVESPALSHKLKNVNVHSIC